MFLRLSIPVPEKRVLTRYGQSRELVAKIAQGLEDQEFVQSLLWVDASNTPRSGLAPFRYLSTRRGRSLDIIALGQEAVELLLAKGHIISNALAREFDTLPSEGRQIGVCSIELSRTIARYRIPRLIIQKHQYEERYRAAEKEHKEGRASAILCDRVRQVIKRDLIRQAELMAIDIPEELQICGVSIEDLKPVKVVQGRCNLSARVIFMMSYKLEGHWAVGHLASRGYGRILPFDFSYYRP
jgi:hypothetical protein